MEKVKNEEKFGVLGELMGERVILDLISAFERKLKIIDEISDMNLPVSDWEEIEEEIIKGAIG